MGNDYSQFNQTSEPMQGSQALAPATPTYPLVNQPYPQYPQQPQYWVPTYNTMVIAPSNGSATAGGVLGIIAFVLSWIPFLGIPIGLTLGGLAVIFGAIGLAMVSRARTGIGMAVTALVLGVVTIIFKLIPGFNLL